MDIFVYLFWPNPGNAFYSSPKVIAILTFCAILVVGSFVIRWWRHHEHIARRRLLSRSWPMASLWFGLSGLVLIVARVEQIQFVAMRLWWVIWGVAIVLYMWFQVKNWHLKYYEVLPQERQRNPMEKYLPRRKPRR
ncbi:hypothetical protein HYZ98_03075 [Candidatus Peregrinibacteria bacterium]|nr:hypothetical protein [Candidatus Peregrinibacteria bacterium]